MPMYGILFFNAVYDLAVFTCFYIILTRNDVVKLYNIWFLHSQSIKPNDFDGYIYDYCKLVLQT